MAFFLLVEALDQLIVDNAQSIKPLVAFHITDSKISAKDALQHVHDGFYLLASEEKRDH